jgi:hypothetical protein
MTAEDNRGRASYQKKSWGSSPFVRSNTPKVQVVVGGGGGALRISKQSPADTMSSG